MSSIDPITLKNRVETALSDELGRYVYQSGDTQPALVIEGGASHDGETPRCDGLEVVIQPYSGPSLQIFLGNSLALDDTYSIILKQWDISRSVSTAVSALVSAFQDCLSDVGPLLPRSSRLDSLEQQTLFINYRRI